MTSRLKFGDCAELRSEKVDPKTSQESKYIGLEHIEQQSLSLAGYGFGSDVDSQKQKFYKGDILFGKLRPYFRKVVVAPFDGICSTDIWVVKPKAGVDRNFLFYWMASEEFIASSTQASEGGRMPRAKWDWVSRFELKFRDFDEQKAIGKVLRLLDEKIEVNKAVAQTLEDIAETIFKSWFVDFDPVKLKMAGMKPSGMSTALAALFPDSMVDSEIGLIPKGWEVKNLGDVLTALETGKRPRGGAQEEGIPSIGAESVRGLGKFNYSTTKYVSEEYYQRMPTGKVRPYDVLIYKDGAGAGSFVAMLGESFPFKDFAINEHVFLLRSNKVPQIYLFEWMNNDKQKRLMVELAQKSAQPGLNQQDTKAIPILVPSVQACKAYEDSVKSIISCIMRNAIQNRTLDQLRDSLIPRLISGDLKISAELIAS